MATLARLSLFPHVRLAFNSLLALYDIIDRDPSMFTLLPSPIFQSSSSHSQYSGLSFLSALSKQIRTVFSEFQSLLPIDHPHFQDHVELTSGDPYFVARHVLFCSYSSRIHILLFESTPPIEVDPDLMRDFILFVKDSLPTVLSTISSIDDFISSSTSPTTPLVVGVGTPSNDSIRVLRVECVNFVDYSWRFYGHLLTDRALHHISSFESIVLADPSLSDIIFPSLKLNTQMIRRDLLLALGHIVVRFRWMREVFISVNLVGRIFESVNFVTLPLDESHTHLHLARFITLMFGRSEEDEDTRFSQYHLIRVSVFDPARQYIIFLFHNSDRLALDDDDDDDDRHLLEYCLGSIHVHLKNMELRSDEHDTEFVCELVKWEVREMVERENEIVWGDVLLNMGNGTAIWKKEKQDREKRREVLLREEGWDDAFELRVVGIEKDVSDQMKRSAVDFRRVRAFNSG
ncbi:hypothetical protein BLNAU_12380 [Blattamonas nauphoetae]|uniref:Uncharacterized protein n=1 Tax=Blattamonas nauphoetae TaxID=2049346 RepID=A0ABQ9XJY2_9EUKA|nr:hypothetical protein BLNAU_12380 [Blattamonas nauphoetae]